MKRLVCAVMLIVPAIVLLTTDVKWMGIILLLLVVADFVTGKRIIIPTCKVMYFMLYVPLWVFGVWRETKRQQKAVKKTTIWYDEW